MLVPRNAPATITDTMTVVCDEVQIPIASSVRANSSSATDMDGMEPKRLCRRGATNTDVIASRMPQPKKT
ncbi:hypothetical protein D3C71_1703510 [compost metagenome]